MGLIYIAYNLVSKKSYIGQTVNSLKSRIQEHYSTTKNPKANYHFIRALRFYNKTDWDWSVIEDNTPNSLLDEREVYWIKQYDSFENGYNSDRGGQLSGKQSNIHKLWHPKHGLIEGELQEIMEITGGATNVIGILKTGKVRQYKGWVLPEHKDNYEEYLSYNKADIYTIRHPEFGERTGSISQLLDTGYFKNYNELKGILNNLKKSSNGWIDIKNINIDYDLIPEETNCSYFKLTNADTVLCGDLKILGSLLGLTYERVRQLLKNRVGDYVTIKKIVYKVESSKQK